MKSIVVTGPGTVEWKEVPEPNMGPQDVLVQVKACGICGSDAMYIQVGGIPPRQGCTCLGHEPSGEVIGVGASVQGVKLGDHIVMNVMAMADGIMGSGGAQGALSERVVILGAEAGKHFRVVPKHIPWEVLALNEPMAVARHAVNRLEPRAQDKVAIFGAGPIGLGALLSLKRMGVQHVVVVDVVANRLEKALAIGADAVINSAQEDVIERLKVLHGEAPAAPGHPTKPNTDAYLDAAGAPVVIETVLKAAKRGGPRLVVVAVHKKPVAVDFGNLIGTELTLRWSMGYPTEIFEVTDDIIASWEKYQLIISHRIPYAEALRGLNLASTPGAAEKVVVVFD